MNHFDDISSSATLNCLTLDCREERVHYKHIIALGRFRDTDLCHEMHQIGNNLDPWNEIGCCCREEGNHLETWARAVAHETIYPPRVIEMHPHVLVIVVLIAS